tara:strand:+ start:742 stop:1125 length:384 start_codon:yes stop_codon:yes gene_type:complete
MFIINGITNFISVSPDSFSPLKHMSAINLIFWLALSLFFFENALIMLFQYGLQNLSKYIPFDLTGSITAMINKIFMTTAFPLKFANLIKPFSPFLYTIIYTLIMLVGYSLALTNGVLSFFTDKQINL